MVRARRLLVNPSTPDAKLICLGDPKIGEVPFHHVERILSVEVDDGCLANLASDEVPTVCYRSGDRIGQPGLAGATFGGNQIHAGAGNHVFH